MHLHEDEVPRSAVIIDVDIDGNDGQYSIIRLNADKSLSDWGTRGANSSHWKMNKVEGSNPWKIFVDFFYSALEDAGYDPRPLSDPSDRYGPLGMSSKARVAAAGGSSEEIAPDKGYEEDLVEQEIECNMLGADAVEATENLMGILNGSQQVPPGMSFAMDDDVGRPTLYASFPSDEPGYQVGDLDIGTFETDEKGPEVAAAREMFGGKTINTDEMNPKDIRFKVHDAHKKWKRGLGKIKYGSRSPVEMTGGVDTPDVSSQRHLENDDLESDDVKHTTNNADYEGGYDIEESKRLRADPDVYASALLLSGFTPLAVVKILGTQGLKASMSEEEMSEVRALHSAVISEALACNVVKAHRAIRAGVIARNGLLREDLVERYRRVLFTKRFAQGFSEDSTRLEPFLTFKEQLEFRLRTLKISEVPGQELDVDSARKIVDSLSEEELDAIRSNIEGASGAPVTEEERGEREQNDSETWEYAPTCSKCRATMTNTDKGPWCPMCGCRKPQ